MQRLGVIVYHPGFPIDGFLSGLVPDLRRAGLRLGGLVQHNAADRPDACDLMALEDVATGTVYPISEARGAGAAGCRLDAAGLAAAAPSLLGGADVDLVLVNKFGKQEAFGRGLRDEIAAVVVSGVPLLIAVRVDLMSAWVEFAGEDWTRMEPEPTAIRSWAMKLAAQPAIR